MKIVPFCFIIILSVVGENTDDEDLPWVPLMPEQFGRHLDWDLDANGCSVVPSCGVTWDRTKYFLDPLVTNGAGQYWIADRAERRKELLDEFLVWTAVNDTVTEEEMRALLGRMKE